MVFVSFSTFFPFLKLSLSPSLNICVSVYGSVGEKETQGNLFCYGGAEQNYYGNCGE